VQAGVPPSVSASLAFDIIEKLFENAALTSTFGHESAVMKTMASSSACAVVPVVPVASEATAVTPESFSAATSNGDAERPEYSPTHMFDSSVAPVCQVIAVSPPSATLYAIAPLTFAEM